MRFHVYRRLLAFVGACLGIVTVAQAVEEASEPALESVTVTARKLREDLQQTGAAVAAFSSSDLENLNVAVSTDLQNYVPNLVFKRRGNSGAFGQVIKIRGIGVSDLDVPTSDPSVAVYVDGVFQARAFGPQFELYDVEGIEVLRGPQGTLYGKNALGGAVNIITRKPSGEDGYGLSATLGNFGRREISAAVPFTLVDDRLFARLSAVTKSTEGTVTNDFDTRQKMGDENFTGLRLALRYESPGGLAVDFSADASRQRQTPAPYYLYGLSSNPAMLANRAASFTPYTASNYLVPLEPDWGDLDRITTDVGAGYTNLPPGRGARGRSADNADFYGASLVVEGGSPDGVTLKSISGYRHYKRLLSQDIDGTPVQMVDQVYHDDGWQATQEFQLNTSLFGDRLALVGGLFWMRLESSTDQTNPFFLGLYQNIGLNISALRLTDLESDAYAAYVHGIYSVNDHLKLSAGLRYGMEEKSAHIRGGALTQPNPPYAFDGSRDESWSSPQPKIGIDYIINDDLFVYATMAKGYASGGFNGRVTISTGNFIDTYDEESLWSYELGFKASLFDRRVRFNVAAFYMDYDNVVVQSYAPGGNGQPIGFFLDNAGKAEVKGAEAELQVQATRGLMLRASVGLIEPEFKEFGFNPAGQPIDPSQAHFFDSPETTASVVAEYNRAIGASGGELSLVGDWAYQGRVYFDNSGLDVGKQDGYGIFNASATYRFPGERLSLSLWGKNLGNEMAVVRSANFMAAPLGFAVALFNDPRSYGLTLRYRY